MMDQNIRTHTVGAYVGTPLVNDTVASGDTTVTTDGWTGSVTGLLKKGDVITFASVYDVNPVSGDTLPDLKQFVVTADVNSSSGAADIPVYPAFINSGALKTCSALPADNAAITVLGSASTATQQGLAFHKYAVTWATAQLELPQGVHSAARATDPDTGISIRLVSFYNGLTDVFVTRCDIMYGWAVRRPTWISRVCA